MSNTKAKEDKKSNTDENSENKKLVKKKQVEKYFICKGKSLTSKVGILCPGQEVTGEMIAGGGERIAQLVDAKFIEKRLVDES